MTANIIHPQDFRAAMRLFGAHVNVVTTAGKAGQRGVTVSAACSVSDNPASVLVCLNHANPENDIFINNGVFALNTLSAGQQRLAEVFSGIGKLSQEDRFAEGSYHTLHTGAPIFDASLASFDCTITEVSEVATHRILIGRVEALYLGQDADALIYHNRRYTTLSGTH